MEAPMTETTGTAGTLTSQLLAARLDRLPVSRFHHRLLIAGGLGFTFDAMVGALVAFILPAVTKEWAMSSGAIGTSPAACSSDICPVHSQPGS
jgi:MFS transporter, putative metabolite:H+ symporter